MSDEPEVPICSARGCRVPAVWQLCWNNPRLHPPQRRKIWLACADHRESLERFLSVRGFLRETLTSAVTPSLVADSTDSRDGNPDD